MSARYVDTRAATRRALLGGGVVASILVLYATSALAAAATSLQFARCQPSQLVGATSLQGAAQSMLGGITVTNRSHTACELPLRPIVRLIHGTHVLAKHERAWTAWKSVGFSHAQLHVLLPGKRAYVILQWRGCSPWLPAPDTYFTAEVQVALPGSRGLFYAPLPDQITESCPTPGAPSILAVSYFIAVP